MIPYYEFSKSLFDIPFINRGVHVFGVLVVIGVLLGLAVANWKAKKMNIDKEKFSSMTTIMLISGFLMAHIFDTVVYRFDLFIKNPLIIFNILSGISSFGGFLGAILAVVIYAKISKLDILEYVDTIAFALPFGWFFGRLGCASIHDHPGIETTFFLGIKFPDGIVRHDLGFYEAIFTFFIVILFFFLKNKNLKTGTYSIILCLLYSPIRFYFDTLRSVDIRYFGLTPGQYSSLVLLIIGLILLKKLYFSSENKNNESNNIKEEITS